MMCTCIRKTIIDIGKLLARSHWIVFYITRLLFGDFSQIFLAMLLRLVGTADTAGDCEKSRRWRDATARRRHG